MFQCGYCCPKHVAHYEGWSVPVRGTHASCVKCGILSGATYSREQMWNIVCPAGGGQEAVGEHHNVCPDHKAFHWARGEQQVRWAREMLEIREREEQERMEYKFGKGGKGGGGGADGGGGGFRFLECWQDDHGYEVWVGGCWSGHGGGGKGDGKAQGADQAHKGKGGGKGGAYPVPDPVPLAFENGGGGDAPAVGDGAGGGVDGAGNYRGP